ncbi:MAG: 2'-5' RNA ligase family protein, partial [Acinetobacter sp.]|nr:2'-5' RNA ligase family protein [Acinetobacter sp.]
ALFIEIQDHENSLSNIRQLLSYPSHEIAALDYCPHITLGLYSAEFKAQQIFKAIETIDQKSFEIGIDQLNFGIYQAQVLQGPLATLHQLILNPKKTDGSWESNLCCN